MSNSDVRIERIAPRPEVLMESLRDIGYSMPTAVADIVDNAIAAGASIISLLCDTSDESPAFAVIDDGSGMHRSELRDAMRPGSRSPRESRSSGDLGRFGLGMKTASLSQCRRLVVVTRRDGQTSAASWDLDVIAEEGDWVIEWIDELASIRWIDRLPDQGTMILWEKLDRPSASDSGKTLNRIVEEVERHVALVFHRFMDEAAGRRRVRFTLNNRAIEPYDPFAEKHPATVRSPEELIVCDGRRTIVRAFTLPHHAKCTEADWNRIAGDLGHVRSQGFYLYRGLRLIVSGTWFRLARQTEMTKLARVRIDIDNDADDAWGIDVRKSTASPPPAVRERLGRLVEAITGSSRRTYERRGVVLTEENPLPVWRRRTADGRAVYELNADHPAIGNLRPLVGAEGARDFDRALRLIAATLPLDALLHDLSTQPNAVSGSSLSDDEVSATAIESINRLMSSGIPLDDIRRNLASFPPFRDRPYLFDQAATLLGSS